MSNLCPFCQKKIVKVSISQKHCLNFDCRRKARNISSLVWRRKNRFYFKAYNAVYKVKNGVRKHNKVKFEKQLAYNHQRYESNFKKLQQSVGTKRYVHYCKIENKLNKRCIDIQDKLKINIANSNPCWNKPCYYDCQKTVGKKQCPLLQ